MTSSTTGSDVESRHRSEDYGPGTVPTLPAPLVPARPNEFSCKEIARLGTLNKNLRYRRKLRVPQDRAPPPHATQIYGEEISRGTRHVLSSLPGSGVAKISEKNLRVVTQVLGSGNFRGTSRTHPRFAQKCKNTVFFSPK